MALPKFGASGLPVFASTGLPAFSCGTAPPPGIRWIKWRAGVVSCACWHLTIEEGPIALVTPPSPQVWTYQGSCGWIRWVLESESPPTDRPPNAGPGCCCANSPIGYRYDVTGIPSFTCGLNPYDAGHFTSASSPNGTYFRRVGNFGNDPCGFAASGTVTTYNGGNCTTYTSTTTTQMGLNDCTPGQMFVSPVFYNDGGIPYTETLDSCGRQKTQRFRNQISGVGGEVLKTWLYIGDPPITPNCNDGFGPEDFA